MFSVNIARLLQRFNNIFNSFQNILVTLSYFISVVCNISKNISLLCGLYFKKNDMYISA